MTEVEAQDAERAWNDHAKEAEKQRWQRSESSPLSMEHQIAGIGKEAVAAYKGHTAARGFIGDRNAVLEGLRSALTDEDRQRWQLLLLETDFAKVAAQGFRSAQLSLGRGRDRACPACQGLDQRIVNVGESLAALLPANCHCVQAFTLSGAIKRPDGSVYFDRG